MAFLFVGIGGFAGACTRYIITKAFTHAAPNFPFGTLASNIIAALAIGFIIGAERQAGALPANTKLFLTTGLLGGLSTFSTFSLETVNLFENGRYLASAGNILLNVGISILFVIAGISLAKAIVT